MDTVDCNTPEQRRLHLARERLEAARQAARVAEARWRARKAFLGVFAPAAMDAGEEHRAQQKELVKALRGLARATVAAQARATRSEGVAS